MQLLQLLVFRLAMILRVLCNISDISNVCYSPVMEKLLAVFAIFTFVLYKFL